jgi:hypothetical protein
MRKSKSLQRFLLVALCLLTVFFSKAQLPSFELYVTNESQPDSKTYQFDVYLLSTGTIPLELANIQFGLGFDTSIANGGILTFSYVKGSSQLNANQAPINVSITKPGDAVVINDLSYRFLNQLARVGPGPGNATIIGSTKAAVLPVPVLARPITSRPSRIGLIAPSCTAVGYSWPFLVILACKSATKPKSLNL